MKVSIPPREIAESLVQLLKADLVGLDTLVAVAQRLSQKGFTRLQIMTFYFRIMLDYETVLSEGQIDMLGDVNLHLTGQQCRVDQIIRLSGDPEDPLELYESVREQMKNWKAPT